MNRSKQIPSVVVALLVWAGGAPGQDRPPAGYGLEGRLDTKELAKAKFAACRADLRDLAAAKVAAARLAAEARFREFLAGRGTLDLFLESLGDWMKSERDLLGPDDDPTAIVELYWAQTWVAEAVNQRRHESGRIPTKDYLETRYTRLGAELELVRVRQARRGKPSSGPVPAEAYSFLLGTGGVPAPALARAQFEAAHADPARLAEARLEAMQYALMSRLKEFGAGRGTLDVSLKDVTRWAEADAAVSGERGRVPVLEKRWALAWLIDDTDRSRYDAGRIPVQDYLQSKYDRLGVELELARLRAEHGKERAAKPPPLVRCPGLEEDLPDTKDRARARFAAERADPGRLARDQYEAAREMHAARFKEFLAGRGSLDILLEASLQLLDSGRALAHTDADRLAVLERHWGFCTFAEAVNRRRYEDGRIPIQDYMQTRRARLQAEIWLVQARRVVR